MDYLVLNADRKVKLLSDKSAKSHSGQTEPTRNQSVFEFGSFGSNIESSKRKSDSFSQTELTSHDKRKRRNVKK